MCAPPEEKKMKPVPEPDFSDTITLYTCLNQT